MASPVWVGIHRKLVLACLGPPWAYLLCRPRHQVMFNASTEHVIMIPSSAKEYLGLASKRWVPVAPPAALRNQQRAAASLLA